MSTNFGKKFLGGLCALSVMAGGFVGGKELLAPNLDAQQVYAFSGAPVNSDIVQYVPYWDYDEDGTMSYEDLANVYSDEWWNPIARHLADIHFHPDLDFDEQVGGAACAFKFDSEEEADEFETTDYLAKYGNELRLFKAEDNEQTHYRYYVDQSANYVAVSYPAVTEQEPVEDIPEEQPVVTEPTEEPVQMPADPKPENPNRLEEARSAGYKFGFAEKDDEWLQAFIEGYQAGRTVIAN